MDIAAGIIIVKEAGGQVNDLNLKQIIILILLPLVPQ